MAADIWVDQTLAVLLYHFTSRDDWLRIRADRLIDLQQCKWDQDGLPKALSFSTSPDVGALPRKLWGCAVRITVDIPEDEVHFQRQWLSKHLGDVAASNLCNPALHGGDFRHWRTVERSVPASEWTRVDRVEWTQVWPDDASPADSD